MYYLGAKELAEAPVVEVDRLAHVRKQLQLQQQQQNMSDCASWHSG